MRFAIAFILLSGHIVMLCWALVHVIWSLSRTSFHAPPQMAPMPDGILTGVQPEHASGVELHEPITPELQDAR
jgi:hypothetical protein